MISERDLSAAIGSTAHGSDGAPVGTVETFYTDDRTGATTWVSVSSGLLGTRRALAPVEDATFADGRLQLTVPADAVSRDPRVVAAYEADPLIWHGPFRRPTLEAIVRALAAVQDGPSLGGLPLMWAHGEDDRLVPLEGSRSGIAHLRGETYVERLYPGARHEIFNETNRDEVLADVVAFVQEALQR